MTLSAADKAIRATGIGASEAWKVVLGNGHDVWLRLVHPELVEDFAPNLAMRKGIVLEDLAADLYAERRNVPLSGDGSGTLRHRDLPYVLATIDRIAMREVSNSAAITHVADRVVEIKCPTIRTREDWGPDGSDEFPLKYRIQCTIQMAVTGLRACDLVALIEGEDDIRVHPVAWDEELAALIIGRLRDFWHGYVLTREPPPADATHASAELLAKRYPRNRGEMREPNLETIVSLSTGEAFAGDEALVAELRGVRAQMKQLEERERLLVNLAKERTGDLDGVEGCWTWKAPKSGNGTTAWKAVAQELGASRELVAKHTKPAGRTFRLIGTTED